MQQFREFGSIFRACRVLANDLTRTVSGTVARADNHVV